ncbi:hypothetical protein MN608_05053 [Microdochium nivale]|nr:hypothetical protein MN608_05053 [Microdochium nivale]
MSMLPSPFSRWRAPQPRPENDDSRSFNLSQHLEGKEINSQLASPFYSGQIPAEIRTLIFEYALTESPSSNAKRFSHDTMVRRDHEPAPALDLPTSHPFQKTSYLVAERPFHDEEYRDINAGFDWLRPDNTRPVVNHYNLLLTCRRVYLETHALPLAQKQFVFYCFRGNEPHMSYQDPRSFQQHKLGNRPSSVPGKLLRDIAPRSVRLFTQQFWLEDTDHYLQAIYPGRPRWFAPLEHLHITLRRGDWWDWERNQPLKISPYRRSLQSASDMLADMARLAARGSSHDGTTGPFGDGDVEDQHDMFEHKSWGLAFREMTNLKTLTMDFETAEDKKEELDRIVEWSIKWRFPLAPSLSQPSGQHNVAPGGEGITSGEHNFRRYLSAEGQPVEKMSWRGTRGYWSMRCAACPQGQRMANEACPGCQERQRLEIHGLGPRLYVSTVTWKAVIADEQPSRAL